MILAKTLISDVKEDFEGGVSLAVDWDTLIRRAVKQVLKQVRPETLKRVVPIYGGLADNVYSYYCPDNVLVPSDLYSSSNRDIVYNYTAPKIFYQKQETNTYTIEYINGVRFLMVQHGINVGSLTIDEMNEVGTKTGGTPTLNSHLYLVGKNTVEATFTDAGVELKDAFTTAQDISDYLRGVIIVPAYLSTASKLASIEFRLKTDNSNYYKVISTTDSIGDYLKDGWNIIKFEMAGATKVGTPNATNITEWSIVGTTITGETLTIPFDKITLQKFNPYFFEFYSSAPFVSGSGKLWQTTISHSDNDKINFNDDLADILHYELCLLVVQSSTFDKIDSQSTKRFEGQLQRAYQAYWETHPSSEAPVSYSKSPEIDIHHTI